jgi:quercetin dioxygenase-like cupin family protein
VEEDWCLNGHVGYVLSGEMSINFNGIIHHFKQGDGLWIEPTAAHQHKVMIEKGKQVELILFEAVG